MKRSFLYAGLCLLGLGGTHCQRADNAHLDCYQTRRAPVIDGQLDSLWTRVKAEKLVYQTRFDSGIARHVAGTGNRDFDASFRALWDADHLYLLFEVTDNFTFRQTIYPENPEVIEWIPWTNDGIEIFFDMDNDKQEDFQTDRNDFRYELAFNYPAVTSVTLASTANIKFSQRTTPSGYLMEVQIPWKNLNYRPRTGKPIGFEINVSDVDKNREGATSREAVLKWSEKDGLNAYRWTSVYGNLTLQPALPDAPVPARLATKRGDE